MVEIVASEAELPPDHRVWGTGGWLMPEQREALDWLTLCLMLGWDARVVRRVIPASGGAHAIVLGRDPDELGEDCVAAISRRLASEPILVIARAGRPGGSFARLAGASRRSEVIMGRSVRWTGPGGFQDWCCREPLEGAGLDLSAETTTWSTLDGAPLIVARREGRGTVATLAFHPSEARDKDGAATSLLKHLIIWGSLMPVAWLELGGTLVLRMDDPGGAQNVFSAGWRYAKLGEAEWAAIAADLRRRQGRLSIGYVGGWVDDGDATRGELHVNGSAPARVPGLVYPSPLVRYRDLAGHAPGALYDYSSEYRGIERLRAAGLGEVELHGYTHMHPDTSAWAAAPDRYHGQPWFRELGKTARAALALQSPQEHSLALGVAGLERYFQVRPTTLIPPGDEWTDEALERALDLGLQLVSSYYLAIRHDNRFCWTTHVCAPYLNRPDSVWFAAGLPVVGYFHDYEPATEGAGWMSRWLDRWQEAGARRLIDLRELAAALGRRLRVEGAPGELRLSVGDHGAPSMPRPLRVGIRIPTGTLPSSLPVRCGHREISLPVGSTGNGVGELTLMNDPG